MEDEASYNEDDYESFISNDRAVKESNAINNKQSNTRKEEGSENEDDEYKFDNLSIKNDIPTSPQMKPIDPKPDSIQISSKAKPEVKNKDNTHSRNNEMDVLPDSEHRQPQPKEENAESATPHELAANKPIESDKQRNIILSQLYLTQNNSNKAGQPKKVLNLSNPPNESKKSLYTEANDNRQHCLSPPGEKDNTRVTFPKNSTVITQSRMSNSKSYAKSKEEYRQYAKKSYELKRNNNSLKPLHSLDQLNHQVPLSKFEQAEVKYGKLKLEIKRIIAISHIKPTDVSNQNVKMIQYLSSLNAILTDLTETVRLPHTQPNAHPMRKAPNSSMDKAVLEQYKKDFLAAQTKYDQVSDPAYEFQINHELVSIKTKVAYYENENRALKSAQKVSNVLIDKHSKVLPKLHIEIKRLEMDHSALKHQYDFLAKKGEDDKRVIKVNEVKIAELSDLRNKLRQNAKETYGLTQFENIQAKEEEGKRNEKEIKLLMRKNQILQAAIETNRKKYVQKIRFKEREIIDKEEKLASLLRQVSDKTHQIEHFEQMVNALYSIPLKNDAKRDEIAPENDDELAKAELIKVNDMLSIHSSDRDEEQPDAKPEHNHPRQQQPASVRNEDKNKANEMIYLTPGDSHCYSQGNVIEKKKVNDCFLPLIETPNQKRGGIELTHLPTFKSKYNNSSTKTVRSQHKQNIAFAKGDNAQLRIDQFQIDDYNKGGNEQIIHELNSLPYLRLVTNQKTGDFSKNLQSHDNHSQPDDICNEIKEDVKDLANTQPPGKSKREMILKLNDRKHFEEMDDVL